MSNQLNTDSSDDWCVYCSDDEKYGVTSRKYWEPPASEIIKLYSILDRSRDEAFELEWQCPGRRGPSPSPEDKKLQEEAAMKQDQKITDEKDDFDFMDEMSSTKFTRTGNSGPKGSAKKKTTSFDGVLSNMRRHRLIDQTEMSKAASNKK